MAIYTVPSSFQAEQLLSELEDLKARYELTESELALLKKEIELKGPESVGADYEKLNYEQTIEKLKDAVVKLRDINQSDR